MKPKRTRTRGSPVRIDCVVRRCTQGCAGRDSAWTAKRECCLLCVSAALTVRPSLRHTYAFDRQNKCCRRAEGEGQETQQLLPQSSCSVFDEKVTVLIVDAGSTLSHLVPCDFDSDIGQANCPTKSQASRQHAGVLK